MNKKIRTENRRSKGKTVAGPKAQIVPCYAMSCHAMLFAIITSPVQYGHRSILIEKGVKKRK
jgi:hypothetical protein